MDEKIRFHEILKKLLQEKGITQTELASYLGLKPQTVSMYCSGKSYPEFNTLIKLSSFFDVSTDYLITGHNPELIRASKVLEIDVDIIENLSAMKEDNITWHILKILLTDKKFYEVYISSCSLAIKLIHVYLSLIEKDDKETLSDCIKASVAVPAEEMRDYFLRFFNEFPKYLSEIQKVQEQSINELSERN